MPVDVLPLLLPLAAVLCLIAGAVTLRFSRTKGAGLLLAGFCLFGAFLSLYFVPVWWMAITAKTPQEEYRVGRAYIDRGSYNFSNSSEAAKWYEKAAEGGYVDAQLAIGHAYLWGRGVPRDRDKARYWLEKAAAQGDQQAQKYLDDPTYWKTP